MNYMPNIQMVFSHSLLLFFVHGNCIYGALLLAVGILQYSSTYILNLHETIKTITHSHYDYDYHTGFCLINVKVQALFIQFLLFLLSSESLYTLFGSIFIILF